MRTLGHSSMRINLTLWYTGILALILVLFSVATYFYIDRSTRRHIDDSLSDTANGFISNFQLEVLDEDQTPLNALKEAAAGFHFRDRQAIVLDERNSLVTSSHSHDKLPTETSAF